MAHPEPGMALNPPVPHPQFKKHPERGALEIIGDLSPVTSTIPPHCRSIFNLEIMGKVSIKALTVSSI
jgi:hypothetical protein